MNKKINGIIILAIILSLNFYVINAENTSSPLIGGWVEEKEGVKILHISGTSYDMGYQHGYLLKEEIEQNYRAIFNLDNGELHRYIFELWNNTLKKYIPDNYIEELQGLAKGSGQTFENVVVYNIGFATFLFDSNCMEMSAWGAATDDGKLIHMRSYDIPLHCRDPESGVFLQDNQILIIRKPTNGYLSLYPSFAGEIFCKGGINEQGIGISCESSPSDDVSLNATWFSCRILMVLDNASTEEKAIEIMTSSLQGSSNYIISDGKIPIAYVCEESAEFSYIGTWNSDIESTKPFWKINNVIRRKNFYIHPNLASTQRRFYDLRFYFILDILPDENKWYTPWRFYKTLSEEVEKKWGKLDINNTMDLLRDIYRGNTDFILWIYKMIDFDPFTACRQWVSYPINGDFVISFADGKSQAQYNQIHNFNLYNLNKS